MSAELNGDVIARFGNLEMLKALPDLRFGAQAIDFAASKGHYDIVVWLHERGHLCTTKAMDEAATNGHLNVVQYLHDRTEGCTAAAMFGAVQNGHLDVAKFLHSHRAVCLTPEGLLAALKIAHPNVVEWLCDVKPHVTPQQPAPQAAIVLAGSVPTTPTIASLAKENSSDEKTPDMEKTPGIPSSSPTKVFEATFRVCIDGKVSHSRSALFSDEAMARAFTDKIVDAAMLLGRDDPAKNKISCTAKIVPVSLYADCDAALNRVRQKQKESAAVANNEEKEHEKNTTKQ